MRGEVLTDVSEEGIANGSFHKLMSRKTLLIGGQHHPKPVLKEGLVVQ